MVWECGLFGARKIMGKQRKTTERSYLFSAQGLSWSAQFLCSWLADPFFSATSMSLPARTRLRLRKSLIWALVLLALIIYFFAIIFTQDSRGSSSRVFPHFQMRSGCSWGFLTLEVGGLDISRHVEPTGWMAYRSSIIFIFLSHVSWLKSSKCFALPSFALSRLVADWHTLIQTYIQTDRQTDMQRCRNTDTQTYIQTYYL